MGETTKKLLEKMPAEKCWALTAKFIQSFFYLLGSRILVPLFSKGEDIYAPVMGYDKFEEITAKVFGEHGRKMLSMVKKTFNIPVKDAKDAYKLYIVAGTLNEGPEFMAELVEETRERVVFRRPMCAWWERYKEFEIDPEFMVCLPGHQRWGEEGFKAINHKLTFRPTKAISRGDPYCEFVIEFKEK